MFLMYPKEIGRLFVQEIVLEEILVEVLLNVTILNNWLLRIKYGRNSKKLIFERV